MSAKIYLMNISLKILLVSALLFAPSAFAADSFEEPPINYSETTADNPVSKLQASLDAGEASLTYDPELGYLKSLLDLLGVPEESQVLVFSKTSLQIRRINPSTPRAIYFNDDVYIGTVQHGALLEISSADPKLGTVFYTLAQKPTEKPAFVREQHDCLGCHATNMTRGFPGHVVRSVFPAKDGQPIFKAGSLVTDHSTPLEKRWGGWYVTGTHGDSRHRGNQIAEETEHDAKIDADAGANQVALPSRVDTTKYLTPHSDIVAMLVLEHQTRLHNLLTQASFETRMALHRQAISDRIFGRDPSMPSESTQRIVKRVSDQLVDYMIFADEIEFGDPVHGDSGFTEAFEARGPHDGKGRTLRKLDLDGRLFEYPLSFLVYSPQFDGLPDLVKEQVYQRLWNIFTGAEETPDLLHLTNAKCRAVREILIDTKPGLPDYWVK
jgi:hypothetical protein